jgi:flagellar assembly protein FliH
MILLSNIIKSSFYTSAEEKRLIEIIEKVEALSTSAADKVDLPAPDEPNSEEYNESHEQRDQILKDAEELAELQLSQARAKAQQMLDEAKLTIDKWWTERRQQDKAAAEAAAERGFQQGLEEGKAEAESKVRQEYADAIEQAAATLEMAHAHKETLIQEAEPFLIELSSAIASKLLHKQLTLEPQLIVDTIKKVLSRRREQGTITLCVSPGQFTYLSDAKDDLVQALDSQAELLIVPDATVEDHGCVVRSAFGSMDARVETQLTEIKHALLQLARRGEGAGSHE